jgi:hypothetical protein
VPGDRVHFDGGEHQVLGLLGTSLHQNKINNMG